MVMNNRLKFKKLTQRKLKQENNVQKFKKSNKRMLKEENNS